MALAPVDLFVDALRLHPDGHVSVEQRRMSADVDGWTVAAFHVESEQDVHGDHWEVHPAAEEAVCVLAGRAQLVLRPDDAGGDGTGSDSTGGEEAITLTSGTACIVPRGRWHRLELDGSTDLMSITLRSGSRLEKRA